MLHYFREGTGHPLVLIHGLFGGSGYFKDLAVHLGDKFDVIGVDLPGFAGSADIPVPDSVGGYGAAVMALLDSLKLGSFHLVGYSLGGAVAQQMALDHPDRIDRLVAYATKPAVLDEDRFETFEATLERVLNSDVTEVVKAQVSKWFDAGMDAPDFNLCIDASRGVTSASASACLQAVRGWDIRDRMHELKMPVLIVSGDRDRSVSLEVLMVEKKAIENSQLCILPGCGHISHLESPELFYKILLDFFDSSAQTTV